MTYTGKTTHAGKCLIVTGAYLHRLHRCHTTAGGGGPQKNLQALPKPDLRELLWVRGHR